MKLKSVAAARRLVASSMSEADFTATVIQLAKAHGWLVHHSRPARTERGWRTPIAGDAGLPDLVLAHPDGRIIFAELKAEKAPRKLPLHQQTWQDAIHAGRGNFQIEAVVWRPSDLPTIRERLGVK